MPATLVDLPSTLARAAGVAPGRRQDGLDLMRVAAGDGKWSKRDVLIEMGPRNKIGTRNWTYRGIYTSRYTFAAWERDGFRELYDRKSDPFETRNVAKKKRYHKLGQEMMRRTRALRECSGPTCRRNFGKLPRP